MRVFLWGRQLSSCHINNKQSGDGNPAVNAMGVNSIVFLERCRLHGARGAGVTAEPGGSVAIVGCELSDCGDAGLMVRSGGRAVINDSYVYWNQGPGVRVEAHGVVSLEHNDCSYNGGGPMVLEGSVMVRGRERRGGGRGGF